MLVSHVNGGRSWLAVCDRLYQLPLGLVGVAVGVALLPRLSRAVHAKDAAGAQVALDQSITFSLALTLPAAVALTAMPFFLIDASTPAAPSPPPTPCRPRGRCRCTGSGCRRSCCPS
ncbi:MAG: lipid II flippase MurJ [Caulobacteraceae bacterium]